ncbi:MFS transporter [Sphingopyxis panaciterrulae]|uniref:MFS family permease n=1 Tax=Sphingopyxis panaciterrulae TaxID=462372 RepID=A0A7W9EP36_9SPHN|nr:MFS transporter [Sphingopyxis panaciterrulae]MBB5705132.1 MFS family permease [Sphingopyxis panaciterrulae]
MTDMAAAGVTNADRSGSIWRLVLPLMVAEVVGSLELTMIYAAMRSLIADFGSASAAGWLITSFMLSSAAGAALFGRLGDLLGRRRILLAVLVISTAGSVISALTRDLGWLIVGRAMQGAAGSIVPLCFGIVREHAPPGRVPFGVSMLAVAASLASATGLVIGGVIIDLADWSMIFKVTAAMGLLATFCIAVFVQRDRAWDPGAVRDDLIGGLLFIPAAVGLLLAIDNMGHAGWSDRMTLVYVAVAVASLAAWVWRELSVPNPLLQVRLLARPEIGWANACYVALALGAFQGGQIMALFGQQAPETGAGLGLSATAAGFLLLPANFITAACYPFVARMVERHGPRLVGAIGFLMIVVGFGSLILWHHDVALVMTLLVIQSIGLGVVYVTLQIVIVSAAPADRVSEATGMMTVIRATAMAIGAQTVATLLSAAGHHGAGVVRFPAEADYITVFLFVGGTALVGMLIARKLPPRLTAVARPH